MPDEMTTTGSLGGGARKEEDPMSAVSDAIDALRQAMLDEGQDPGTVEAKLHMAMPTETNIVGNYADLQRMGAIAQTGVLPTPPGQEDIETDDITEAFVAVESAGDEGAAGDSDYASMTKADLQAELEAQGIEYNAGDTKQDLIDRLG